MRRQMDQMNQMNLVMMLEYLKMMNALQPAKDLCEFPEKTYLPVLLTRLAVDLKPRDLQPQVVFLNSLCAMAAADGDFDASEAAEIANIVKALKIQITDEQLKKWCAHWGQLTADQIFPAMAQAIVDCGKLEEGVYRNALPESLKKIAYADGKLDLQEIALYHGMLSKLWSP